MDGFVSSTPIDLGRLAVGPGERLLETRSRAAELARLAGVGPIGAARVAVAVSEMCRRLEREGGDGIDVAASMADGEFAILFRFSTARGGGSFRFLDPFFDRVERELDAEGRRRFLVTLGPVRGASEPPRARRAGDLCAAARAILGRLSRQELFEVLERRNRQLEDATRYKSEFLANMSHELRTPMNAIIGFTARVLKKAGDRLPDRQRRNLETVERNARRLLEMINGLLDLSKIEAGKMEVHAEEFSLRDAIRDVEDLIQPLAEARGLELVTRLPEDGIRVLSDRGKLRQILINLAGNAVKFTDSGSVTFRAAEVRCADLAGRAVPIPDRPHVEISVSDTGVGMSAEALSYIFDAFRQVDGSASRSAGGTGLGLSITRRLVRLLEGTIGVESEEGKGTTFTVTIPVSIEPSRASFPGPPPGSAGGARRGDILSKEGALKT